MSVEEKNRKRKSWAVAIMVQVVMLLTFYFLVAWKEPFPPIPSYGIELGFISDISKPQVAAKTQSELAEQVVDDTPEEPTEAIEENSEQAEVIESQENIEEFVDDNSPVESNEAPMLKSNEAPVTPVPEPTEKKEENKPSTTESTEEKVSEENDDGEDNKTVESIPTESPSLDDRAIYGTSLNPGDQGASLQLAGWSWDSKPMPNDKSSESGRIEYEIKVDADGYLSSIKVLSSTVSPSVERVYRESIERLTFSKTNDYRPAAFSSGKVTFIITTK